jgi:hypothetical protein
LRRNVALADGADLVSLLLGLCALEGFELAKFELAKFAPSAFTYTERRAVKFQQAIASLGSWSCVNFCLGCARIDPARRQLNTASSPPA